MNTYNIKVIIGSVRAGSMAGQTAEWIAGELSKQDGTVIEILDLKDYPMPFFDAIETPSYKSKPYENPEVARFTAKIAEGDAFVIVSPEYNHSTSGVLKNALDWVYQEWARKPVAFVGYGSVGGARAIEHLRGIAVELQMAPVRNSVNIPGHQYFPVLFGQADKAKMFASLTESAKTMIDDLLWWTKALKAARNQK